MLCQAYLKLAGVVDATRRRRRVGMLNHLNCNEKLRYSRGWGRALGSGEVRVAD